MALDKELQLLINSLEKAGVKTTDFVNRLKSAEEANKSNVSIIREMERALASADDTATGLYDQLRNITGELQNQNFGLRKAQGAYGQLTTAAQKLAYDEQGISDLSKYQVSQLVEKIESNKKLLAEEAERLTTSESLADSTRLGLKLLQQEVKQMRDAKDVNGERMFNDQEINDLAQERLKTMSGLTDKQKVILASYYDEGKAASDLLDYARERLEEEKKISKAVGVTGALVEGTGALMERLGMRSGIFHDAMKDASEEMRHQAKLLGDNVTFMDKMRIAATGFSIVAKGFSAALFDPGVLVGKIVQGFLDVNKAAVEFTRLTGQNANAIAGLNARLATTVDFLETAAELTRKTGMNAAGIFTPDQLGQLAEAKNLLGLSADEAGNLGIRSKVAGTSIAGYKSGIVDAVNGYNDMNNSVVAHGQILKDVLNTSEGVALSLGGNPKKIAMAAAAARSLGMELSRVDDIAGNLMDFESSIQNELEAQLLTGKSINLAKARELALNNDLEGLSSELAKQGASAAEFSKMNRIQQESLAKALGMSRDELGKMAQQELLRAGASKEAQAAARGVTVEQLEQMNIQDRIQKSLDKLAQAFAPILDSIVPVVETLASMLQPVAQVIAAIAGPLGTAVKVLLTPVTFLANLLAKVANTGFGKVVIGITLVGVAITKLTGGIAGLGGAFGSMIKSVKGGLKNIWSSLTNPKETIAKIKETFTGITSSLKEGFKNAGKIQSKAGDWYDKDSPQGKMIQNMKKGGAADKVSEVSDKAADSAKKGSMVPKKAGQGIKDFLTNLAAGLKNMADGKVIGGAFALIPAALGLTSLLPAIPALIGLQFINGKAIKLALKGIGEGLKAFGSIVSKALPQVGLALLALAGIGAAMIPLTYALSKLAPLISAIGDVIKSAFEGIGSMLKSAGEGIALMLENISLEKVAALALLGPALISASGGLGVFSIAALLAVPGINALSRIASLGPGLDLAGNGITAMAEGVAKLASALNSLETAKLEEVKDLIATTAIAAPAVAATGAITSLIQGISGDDSSTSDPAMIEKLDAILSAIQAGGNVYIDGNKAGQAQVLGTYRQ